MPIFFTAYSKARSPEDALVSVARKLREQGALTQSSSSIALVFCSEHHLQSPEALCEGLEDVLAGIPFLGWTGPSAICGMDLDEGAPGLCVLVLQEVSGYLRTANATELGSEVAAALVADAPSGRIRLLSAPAQSFDPANFFPPVDEQQSPVAGALCGGVPGETSGTLMKGVEKNTFGMLSLDGISSFSAVAQGVRLLGPVREVTRGEGNRIDELDGKPALQTLLSDLPSSLHADLQKTWPGIFAAMVSEDEQVFAMRNLIGFDPNSGSLAVTAPIWPGTTLAFALRDGASARADLEETLLSLKESLGDKKALAVLVFTCLARNHTLFGVPHYDAERVADVFGDVPVVGINAVGEIATIGSQTQLFGHAAVITVLISEDIT
ncbi:MAG: hypothetical protein GY822_08555 [Deltaproteobacteria bacterium]|nr:hypothetical protein [Deltaproteobacteria bacterium]